MPNPRAVVARVVAMAVVMADLLANHKAHRVAAAAVDLAAKRPDRF